MAVVGRHASPLVGEDDQSNACHKTVCDLDERTRPSGRVKIGDYIPPGRQVNTAKMLDVVARATKTVLIVEDDAIVAEIYSLALGRAGYRVMVSRNGADGLEAAAREEPDFIFLDIRMPKMDGIEVLRGLARRGEGIGVPIVMLTNSDDPAIVRESLALGAKGYIVKAGTNPAELADVVSRWLGEPLEA